MHSFTAAGETTWTATSWGRRTSTGSTRNALMKQEIHYKARQRVLKEQYRPKILLSEQSFKVLPKPQTYIDQARQRYLRRTASATALTPSSHSGNLTNWSFKQASRPKPTPQTLANATISPNQSIALPDWLRERKDFAQTVKRMRTLLATTPAEICEREASKRSPEEKQTLLQYLGQLEFFTNLPSQVLSDVADKMRTFSYEKGNFLTQQGEKGDCMFVLASGNVEVLIDSKRIAEFTACHVIGEAALQLDVPRTASVAALTSVTALRLSRLDFESTLSVFKKKERRFAVDFLSAGSVLGRLGLAKLQRLSTILISTSFSPGQVIYDVGNISQSFYILREGQVVIEAYATVEDTLRTPVNTHAWRLRQVSRKVRVLIRESSPGDVFGLADLPARKGRKTRATAKAPCLCYIINLHQFLELFTERDLEELLLCEDMRLPKMQELVEKAHEDLTVMKEKRRSLLRAYSIADDKFAVREWCMDKKTKRMKGWMTFMRKCMATEVANMQRKVVSTHKSMRLVTSLSQLQALSEVKPKA